MRAVTYTQVEELVKRLSAAKLARVYSMILKMTESEDDTESPQINFERLPLSERRKIMRQQAKEMAAQYKKTAVERQEWQGGDFVDEY
ncbi:MAG TPA: hypothetical protein VK186_00090 [Candidatus Deferrimicrobium sp.]|nr:hypothetical protein [Candidatus Deferrimicrobium sp.]